MKITAKTTKEQMKEFLKVNHEFIKDKNLADRVAYALKVNDDKITRKDLADLVKEVDKVIDEVPTKKEAPVEKSEPKAENSVKKLNKGDKKKAEAPTTEKETKAPKKSEAKKEQPKDEASQKFPKDITVTLSDGSKAPYTLAPDINTMEDLHKALENEEDIVFAFHCSKRMLKEAPYFYDMLGHPKAFENDLDMTKAIYVSDEFKVAYSISMTTEACYSILPDDFEVVDGMRFAGTMQFQIYRGV